MSRARLNADRKLPKRRRIVRSIGTISAAVHESAVGNTPNSATKLRTASRARASRSSEGWLSSLGSPSNTVAGFALWELRSTSVDSNPWRAYENRTSGLLELNPHRVRGLLRDVGAAARWYVAK